MYNEYQDKYYEQPRIVFTSEPSYWNENDDDYKLRKNLLRDAPYDIIPDVPIDGKFRDAHFNTLASQGRLTDGVRAKVFTYCDPALNRFSRGAGRSIVFDLGHLSAVDSWSASMVYELSTLVTLPDEMTVYGSADGIGWKKLCTSTPPEPKFDNDRVVLTGDFGGRYIIRYFKVYFKIDLHIYFEQFELYGTKDLSGAAEIVPDEPEIKEELGFPTPESFYNVHNMALMYHCAWDDNDKRAFMDKDFFRPLVGYYKDGKLTDTLFDAYLFLPLTRFEFAPESKNLAGWKQYLYSQFKEECNLDALNKVTGETAAALGLDDYKSKVFFSLLCPRYNITDFGDIDGSGSLNFNSDEDSRKAIKWLVDEHIRLYKEGNYNNTELCGFYWFQESTAPREIALLKYAGDYVRSLGYRLFWIPYYIAAGFSDWKKLGFDLACMQPNYVFQKDADKERLYINAEICRKKGMCVEMEVHWDVTPELVKRYLEYLEVGAEVGYMKSVKIYYEGGSFVAANKSSDKLQKLIYDYTYKFAKEVLTPEEAAQAIAEITE